MSARSGKPPIAHRFHERFYLGGPGKPPIISIYWTKDAAGTVQNYGLAYIDLSRHPRDNGRVLGYDNGHGVHERHFMGSAQPVDFISYEATARRFFAEVEALRKGEAAWQS